MTLSEKIIAAHCGRDSVKAGDLVMARVDMVLGTDVTVPLSVKVFREMGATKVFDPAKIALVNDHFVPAKDVQAATLSQTMRNFAREQNIPHYYEVGRSGICHSLLPDEGLVKPGDLVVGADSHTCTYGALGAFSTGIGSTDMACVWALGELWFRVPETVKVIVEGDFKRFVGAKDLILYIISQLGVDGAIYQAIEFGGSTIRGLSMDARFTICNMAIEAGAKTGLIEPDETTWEYVSAKARPRAGGGAKVGGLKSDQNAEFVKMLDVDAGELKPMVAAPYLPSNVMTASYARDVKVDQVVIGSCTNGRMEDFRVAAEVIGKRPVDPNVRLLIIPATQGIFQGLMKEGLAETFVAAGAVITPPTCGPCIGGHMGVLAAGEVGLFTTNRNFHGRNGHPDSKVYLAGPAVAAASAVSGHITDPNDL
jgi:3-isopropylmalate/(R)-2-methylmalate dehydratase large subunit